MRNSATRDVQDVNDVKFTEGHALAMIVASNSCLGSPTVLSVAVELARVLQDLIYKRNPRRCIRH